MILGLPSIHVSGPRSGRLNRDGDHPLHQPSPHRVRGPLVLTAGTSDVLRMLDRTLLGGQELRRCAAARDPAERDARAAARLLARWGAALLSDRPIETLEVHQRCAHCGSPDHGRPWLPGLPAAHVSLAHTRGAVAAGVGWHPVGVDIETTSGGREIGLGTRSSVLTATERVRVASAPDPTMAFLRHWTVKECLVKVGVATLDTLAEVDVGAVTGRRTSGARSVSRYGRLHLTDWFDEQLDAMVAAVGVGPPEIVPFPLGPDVARRTARSAW